MELVVDMEVLINMVYGARMERPVDMEIVVYINHGMDIEAVFTEAAVTEALYMEAVNMDHGVEMLENMFTVKENRRSNYSK